MSDEAETGEWDLVATLRDGSEHVLILDHNIVDAAHLLDEVSAGRSQLLRGWVVVRPPVGAAQAVVSGDEIVQLRLVERRAIHDGDV
jgi:hypothetical protein